MKLCIIDNNGKKCLTKNTKDAGPQKGRPCQLPWTDPWINQTHQGCANPNKATLGGEFFGRMANWCPTKTNDGKLMMADWKKGFWGFCNEKCLHQGKSIILELSLLGVLKLAKAILLLTLAY